MGPVLWMGVNRRRFLTSGNAQRADLRVDALSFSMSGHRYRQQGVGPNLDETLSVSADRR